MKSEKEFKVQVLAELRSIPDSWFYKVQAGSVRGIPDIIGVICGQFIGMELKKSSKARMRPLQEYNLDKIGAAGGLPLLVHPENWPEMRKLLWDIYAKAAQADVAINREEIQ